MVGEITHQMRTVIFRDMLEICQLRGRDSSGVIRVGKDLEYDYAKRVGPPLFLLDSREYEGKIERREASALIGHCRAKTVGENTVKNAHPFDFPERGICGVHNGTLRGYHNLDTHEYNKVDSEILYGHMALNGARDTFESVEGAYACVWWDNQEKTINFARNSERPLWFTWSKDLKTMFWASEPWWFGAVERKIDLWDGGEEKKKFVELPVHQIWSFRLNPGAKGEEKLLTQRPVQVIVPKQKTVYPSHNRNWAYEDSRWERIGPGVHQRVHKASGGEVSNPFQVDRDKLERQMQELWDELPEELTGNSETPTESNKEPLSNVAFLRRSVTSSASSMQTTPTRNSNRPVLSLPRTSSSSLALSNSGVPCTDIEKQTQKSRLQISRGVSLRTVLDVTYITQNITKTEWPWEQIKEKAGGKCCFCKEPIDKAQQVAEILSETKIICKSCMEEPKGSLLLPKGKIKFGS